MKSKNIFLSPMRYLLFFFIAVFLIIVGLWIIVVQEDTITKVLKSSIITNSLNIEIEGLKKGLFYNLDISRLRLKENEKILFNVESISVKINPLYLFLLRHKSYFNGRIQSGIISGNLSIGRNKRLINVMLDNIDIKDIPYLKTIGLKGTGVLNANVMIRDNNADIKFAVNDAKFETVTLSRISLPMEIFDKAKGVVSIINNVISIDSFSLEGTGIYGRIKGTIKDGNADLSLEIMPDASARERFPVLLFVDKYRVSPGYYVIPIKMGVDF